MPHPFMSNSDSTRVPHARLPARAWCILILCGFAGALFYLDRQTLSVLKTTLKSELGWSDRDYGHLVSLFMFCYTACYLFTGRWIDRLGTRVAMPLFLGLMSIAMILSGLASTLGAMGLARGLLGLAEAGVMPAIMVAVYHWFPPERRGMAATVKEPIYVVGQIAATPAAAMITQTWNWHVAFFVPGVLGLVATLLWVGTDRHPVAVGPKAAAKTTSYLNVLRRKEIWGVIAARLVSDPLWFFLLYWEPGYLQERLGLSLAQLARIGWIPTAVATATLIGLGFLSDRWVTRLGWAPARSRRLILQIAAGAAPALLLLPFANHAATVIILLCVVRVMAVVWLNFTNILMADLVPTDQIGTAIALMSAIGAATSLVCNTFVGAAVEAAGYGPLFMIGACLHPLAALILWRYYRRS